MPQIRLATLVSALALLALPVAAWADDEPATQNDGPGTPSCLARHALVRSTSLRGVHVGAPVKIRYADGKPVKAAAVTYCVRGGGQFGFALSNESEIVLVGSTSERDSIGPINPTSPDLSARAEFPEMRKLVRSNGTTVYRIDSESQMVLGVKDQRVNFVGVADRLLLEYPNKLGYWLKKLEL